jgi:DNA-binding IclR family transcriptional regulator
VAAAGTQSLERALSLLRTIATGTRQGWRLSDLASACKLTQGTTHRLLQRLCDERLVARDGERRYVPGPMLFELGLAFPRPLDLVEATRIPLASIATEFAATCSLWLRSGPDLVCAARVGKSKTRVFVDVGTRRPLASMAPGIAILQGLPRSQRRVLVAENFRRMQTLFPGREAGFRAMLARSEKAGYGITYGDVGPGMYAIGAALAAPDGAPVAAIAAIGTTASLPRNRVERLARRLHDAAATIVTGHGALLAGLR